MKVIMTRNPTQEDWNEVKKRALVTAGLTMKNEPTMEWKQKMLRARHSPIRYLNFSFLIQEMPYWLSNELCRHHVGCEKYVKSQRDDRNNDPIPRDKKPQGALVNVIFDCNAESLMVLMNKRLCGKATIEMQKLMNSIKTMVETSNPEFIGLLVPFCGMTGGICHELESCGKNQYYIKNKGGMNEA